MKKGTNLESDYFMREDLASKHKAKTERERVMLKAHDEELKKLHFMKCPKCGHDLESKKMTYVTIEQCSSCGAIVIDADQVDKFITEKKSILNSLIAVFKP
jgi:uncharacterized protein